MYTIKITYTTGNSFNTEYGREENVGYAWKNLDKATEALQRIKEHYAAYEASAYHRSYKKNKKDYSKERWFINDDELGWSEKWQYQVAVPTDDNKTTAIHSFWCGHFESLESAEVVFEPDDPEDLSKYSFKP